MVKTLHGVVRHRAVLGQRRRREQRADSRDRLAGYALRHRGLALVIDQHPLQPGERILADLGEQAGEVDVLEARPHGERLRAGTRQDVRNLQRPEAGVDRDGHGAEPSQGEIEREIGRHIRQPEGDLVAAADAVAPPARTPPGATGRAGRRSSMSHRHRSARAPSPASAATRSSSADKVSRFSVISERSGKRRRRPVRVRRARCARDCGDARWIRRWRRIAGAGPAGGGKRPAACRWRGCGSANAHRSRRRGGPGGGRAIAPAARCRR